MKQLLFAVGILVQGICFSQTDQLNLEKYWKFRNTFREKFVKIGPLPGESLPAGAIKPNECKDTWDSTEDGTPWWTTAYGEMHWGDGMIRHGHYLGLLATEYKLLKNSGQDVTGVLNELYYALNAINRLDYKAESELASIYNTSLPQELNGFFLREDIPENFASTHWGNDPIKAQCVNSAFYKNNNSGKISDTTYQLEVFGNSYQNVPSMDQMTSLIIGLSLIHKLVDDSYVKPMASDAGFNIVAETKLIMNRIISYASDHNWFLIDVNGWPVANGGGDICFAAYPFQEAAKRVIHPSISYNPNFTRRNFIYNWAQHCITGFGQHWNISQQTACNNTLNDPLQQTAYNALVNGGGIAGPANNQHISMFQTWQNNGNLTIPISLSSSVWQNLAVNISNPEFFSAFNRDKYLKQYNRTIIFNLGVASGKWDQTQGNSWGAFTENKSLELINAVIRGETPAMGSIHYRGYLDNMPIEGSYNLTASNNAQTVFDSKFQTGGWAAEYKWTNPDQALGAGDVRGIFSTLDYMLFHNLYRLLFIPNTSNSPTTNCFCYPATSKPVGGSQAQIEATNALNYKLSFLETCTPDVFTPVSQTISGVFNIEPKFADYAEMKIFTNDYEVNNATITSTGTVNVRNRFIVCNSKTLTIQNSGKLIIEKGEVFINGSARIHSSGEVRIKTGTQLTIRNLGKLSLPAGGKLIIENNAKLIIEAGGYLEYYNGAQVITEGDNSQIVMMGNIKIMDAATFTVDHSASASSGLIIMDGGIFNAEQPNTNIILKGKGRTDEFVVVKEGKQLWVQDPEIALFRLDDCKITFPAGSSIRADQPFRSSGVDYLTTSQFNGITVYKESMFLECNFKNVQISGILTGENSGKLNVTNCNFTRTTTSSTGGEYIFVHGMGYTAQNCTFTNPQLYGIRSANLTLPSTVTSCTFTQNNTAAIGLKDVSTAELIVKSSAFTYLLRGIYKETGKLSLKCNTFQNIKSDNLNILGSCLLNMSTDDNAGYNYLYRTTDNKNVIFTDAIVNIKNGYNYFDDNCQYIFQGTLNHICGLFGSPCYLYATKNQWNPGVTAPAAAKFNLTLTSGGASYPVNTGTTVLKPACGFYDVPNPNDPGNPSGKSLSDQDETALKEGTFELFPNPANDVVHIIHTYPGTKGTSSTLTFLGMDGRVVLNTSITEGEESARTVNVSQWATGVYIYHYTLANGKTFSGKLVINSK